MRDLRNGGQNGKGSIGIGVGFQQPMQNVASVASSPPSVEEVDQVAAIVDPVLRNLRITQHYHLLAVGLAVWAPGGANWCTFAVWASRQAGQTIRGEDVLAILEQRIRIDGGLASGINRLWRRVFVRAIEDSASKSSLFLRIMMRGPLSRASDAVARGNRKVYAEIAREFARFLALFAGAPPGAEQLAAFLEGLRPGPPPDGQDYLRLAFAGYAAALQTTDPAARAEYLFLANLHIGLHEQTRLQPEILEALEVPYGTLTHVGRCLLRGLHPQSAHWYGVVETPIAIVIGAVAGAAGIALRTVMRHLITERMMTLSLPPADVIHLGRNLRGQYPIPLRQPTNASLTELLQRYAPAEDGVDTVAAYDWSVLEQRMRLITRLFRLRHEDAPLFGSPYTVDQVLAFETGRLPDGEL